MHYDVLPKSGVYALRNGKDMFVVGLNASQNKRYLRSRQSAWVGR